jgi:DHA2 family methylenomycin A resistance protein-like MFS transporter
VSPGGTLPTISLRREALVLATASLAGSTAILDASIVNLALPAIGRAFNTSASQLAWTVNAYVLPFAVSILAVGRLGDGFGRRPVLAIGAALFALASAGAAVAPSYALLLLMRALQGLGGSALLTISLAVVSAGVEPERRPRALGIYFAAGATAGAAGPILGGALTSAFGWPGMFAAQVPLALAVLVATLMTIGSAPQGRRSSLDLPGLGLGTLVLLALNVALLQANHWGWTSTPIVAAWLAAALALVLFVLRERSAAQPAVRLAVFGNRRFVASSLVGAAAWFAVFSGTIQLAVYLQAGRHLDPFAASLVIVPWPLAALVVFLRSGAVVARFGSERTMVVALIAAAASAMVMPSFDAVTPLWFVAAVAAAGGAAIALSVTASTTCAVAEFPPAQAGVASGIFNSLRQVGSALGVAIPAAAYDAVTRGSLAGAGALRGSAWALGTRAGALVIILVLVVAILPRARAPFVLVATTPPPG